MPIKTKTLRLSDVISQFSSTVMGKEAGDGTELTPEELQQAQAQQQQMQQDPNATVDPNAQVDPNAVQPDTDGDAEQDKNQAVTMAAQNVVQADAVLTSSVEALKSIAKQAQSLEKEAFAKEATEFGKLFADGFLNEVNEREIIKTAMENAYEYTMAKFAEETKEAGESDTRGITEDTIGQIYNEAYEVTMSKLAEEQESLTEDEYQAIVKEAHELTLNAFQEVDTTDVDQRELAKQAYEFTLNAMKQE